MFGEALKVRNQKYEQTLRKNCSKNTKMAITVCKLSIFSGGERPQTPLGSFLLLKLLKINFTRKTTLKKVTKFGAPLHEKTF